MTIHGTHFSVLGVCSPGTTVTMGYWNQYGSSAQLAMNVQIISDSTITAVAPASMAGVVDVMVSNRCGNSPVNAPADQLTYADPNLHLCPSVGACTVTIDGTHALGAASSVALGLLHGIYPAPSSGDPGQWVDGLLSPLKVKYWRVVSVTSPDAGIQHDYDVAAHFGSKFIYMVSDDWYQNKGMSVQPYDNIDNGVYYAFVKQLVEKLHSAGKPVDYWDVQNEPAGGTPGDWMRVYETAWHAIRDATAEIQRTDASYPIQRIEGPSLASYRDKPYACCLDLTTFLDYTLSHHVIYDALSWHEINDLFPAEQYRLDSPKFASDHITRARTLIASRPGLGNPKLFVNEYSPGDSHLIPGWQVGFISAFEASNVDEASRACWIVGLTQECKMGFDGLLTGDDQHPQAAYWVYRAYAQMVGERVAVSSPADDISAFATRLQTATSLNVLLGRHVNCGQPPRPNRNVTNMPPDTCPENTSSHARAANIDLSINVPFGLTSIHVTAQRIPNARGAMSSLPAAFTPSFTFSGGVAHVHLTNVADGDAYAVSVGP